MLDDGIGPVCYAELCEQYDIDENVDLLEVGCLTADLLSLLVTYDFVMTVDAVNVVGSEPGTIFFYLPEDMARAEESSLSLHDLRLIDLFEMALLCGIDCQGFCLGMQVANAYPEQYSIGLTPACKAAIPRLCEAVAYELQQRGYRICRRREEHG